MKNSLYRPVVGQRIAGLVKPESPKDHSISLLLLYMYVEIAIVYFMYISEYCVFIQLCMIYQN